jgi:ribosomal protein S20
MLILIINRFFNKNEMKNYFTILFVSLIIVSCKSQKEIYNIECVSIENEGYVKLKIKNLIKPIEYQIESANKDAIKAILYSGYTSTQCQTQKPILKQSADIENFKKIESNFFSKNGVWKTFVRNASNQQNTTDFEVIHSGDFGILDGV